MNIIILMAGSTKDFEEKGYSYPKYLIEVQNKPMIQRTIESLKNVGENITCIIRKEDQEKYFLGDFIACRLGFLPQLDKQNNNV